MSEQQKERDKEISKAWYDVLFEVREPQSDLRLRAFETALRMREFEIKMYWTRSAYYWAFVSIAAAGLVVLQGADNIENPDKWSFVISCLGLVFSVVWFFANAGSKKWQENWENHVYCLEEGITGPLSKVTIERPAEEDWRQKLTLWLTGPRSYSVSKINMLLSFYFVLLWLVVALHFLFRKLNGWFCILGSDSFLCTVLAFVSIIVIWCIYRFGKTDEGPYGGLRILQKKITFSKHLGG